MESASWSWEGAWPRVRNDSQNACSQIARVKEKDMKPIMIDARLMGARAGISERIGGRPCEMVGYGGVAFEDVELNGKVNKRKAEEG